MSESLKFRSREDRDEWWNVVHGAISVGSDDPIADADAALRASQERDSLDDDRESADRLRAAIAKAMHAGYNGSSKPDIIENMLQILENA